jgi:hypothetical protein
MFIQYTRKNEEQQAARRLTDSPRLWNRIRMSPSACGGCKDMRDRIPLTVMIGFLGADRRRIEQELNG